MSLLLDAFGSIGLLLLLVAFYLNVTKKIVRNTFTYNGLNLIGSLILVYYAFVLNSGIFIVLESIWAFISLYFLLKLICSNMKKKQRRSKH